jgi:hypothetical protein
MYGLPSHCTTLSSVLAPRPLQCSSVPLPCPTAVLQNPFHVLSALPQYCPFITPCTPASQCSFLPLRCTQCCPTGPLHCTVSRPTALPPITRSTLASPVFDPSTSLFVLQNSPLNTPHLTDPCPQCSSPLPPDQKMVLLITAMPPSIGFKSRF